jgi:heptosyltransferase II
MGSRPPLRRCTFPVDMLPSLVVQTAFIGDMVLTTPLIAELARRGAVDVVGTPANLPLLRNNPHVRHTFAYDKRAPGRLRSLLTIGRELRAGERYDAAYLAQGSIRSAALAVVAGAKVRVGFDTSGGRHLYTLRVPFDEGAHHAERLLQLSRTREQLRRALAPRPPLPAPVEDVVDPPPDPHPRLYPGAAEQQRVEEFLNGHDAAAAPLVAIAPGSVWATKRWPYYPELAAHLGARARVVVVGSAADRPLADAVRVKAPALIDATGRLSLLESAELIRRCAALVSNDSAPVHIASAMDTPTIAIFGPTIAGFGFGPLAERSVVAGHETLACRPCDRHGPRRCPLGHWRCMGELSPDAVYALLARLIPELLSADAS